ncbi:type II toxin-antitoxin system RelE/ParE family toxin [Flaviflagellibacter deserti]|uniref:Type II toxin-antitoxin system RelE/ParE family toxin n=1 Tax=Flaviflagellibacter deserti TaxID=2267266 RepID=A0ABV9YVC5_9HYPH
MPADKSDRIALPTRRARTDLLDIWSFVAADNMSAADMLIRKLVSTSEMLAENPLAGRLRYDLGNDVRSFAVGRYIVFYRPHARGIEVLRFSAATWTSRTMHSTDPQRCSQPLLPL